MFRGERCGTTTTVVVGHQRVNLYPTNAPDPFKSASYESTKWVHYSHLNAPHSHIQAQNYSPTCYLHIIQGAAERTPLFEKRINSKPKKIRQMFFYFWKAHRMPFYINVF